MKIRPLGDRVLVEPIEEKEQTVGGIIIPDSAKEKPMQGNRMKINQGGSNSEAKNRARMAEADREKATGF